MIPLSLGEIAAVVGGAVAAHVVARLRDGLTVAGLTGSQGKPAPRTCWQPELARWRQERRVRRPVRISLTRISGCSKAAKCPPLSASP